MIQELKQGQKLVTEGYVLSWIGWVTSSSYQISKIKDLFNEKGKIHPSAIEIEWVNKFDYQKKNNIWK